MVPNLTWDEKKGKSENYSDQIYSIFDRCSKKIIEEAEVFSHFCKNFMKVLYRESYIKDRF